MGQNFCGFRAQKSGNLYGSHMKILPHEDYLYTVYWLSEDLWHHTKRGTIQRGGKVKKTEKKSSLTLEPMHAQYKPL